MIAKNNKFVKGVLPCHTAIIFLEQIKTLDKNIFLIIFVGNKNKGIVLCLIN